MLLRSISAFVGPTLIGVGLILSSTAAVADGGVVTSGGSGAGVGGAAVSGEEDLWTVGSDEPDPWEGSTGEAYRARIDVVFCLDVTGSMSAEIAAAKNKIRSIAKKIRQGEEASDQPPVIRFGVVAYRDRTDRVQEEILDLTADVDATYSFLARLGAWGGGDGPENVRRALQAAVHELSWSEDPEAVKMIFLVGDAAPHTDYDDLPSCLTTARKGLEAGISTSTIACGSLANYAGGVELWKQLAEETYGSFEQLPPSRGSHGRMPAAFLSEGPGGGAAVLRGAPARSRMAVDSAAPAPAAAAEEEHADRLSDFVVESIRKKVREKRRR